MEEEVFLGLRKKSGISIARFNDKFDNRFDSLYGQVTQELIEEGLLQLDGQQLRMTKKGLFLGDSVAERFILDGD